jgi:hypothetical protein
MPARELVVGPRQRHRISEFMSADFRCRLRAPAPWPNPTVAQSCPSGVMAANPATTRILSDIGNRPLLSRGLRLGEPEIGGPVHASVCSSPIVRQHGGRGGCSGKPASRGCRAAKKVKRFGVHGLVCSKLSKLDRFSLFFAAKA